jgi:magnesium transporter
MRAINVNKSAAIHETTSDLTSLNISESNEEFVWVDFLSEDKDKERELLENTFNISPLVINDAQRDRHPPKFESFKGYNFLLIKAFDAGTKDIDFNILHISFVISKDYLISIHNDVSPSIDSVWGELESNKLEDYQDPYSLLYLILKKIISRYTKVILDLEGRLDEIEKDMLEKPTDEHLSELIRYSTKTQYLYRIFNNQDIVIKEMLNTDSSFKGNDTKHKFQDIKEHMERLAGLSGLLNEVTKNLIDGYISVTGHRLNNIMKTLTIVALVFMPITFVAGLYGMNFEYIPELSYRYGYFVVLGVMAIMAIALLVLFKKLRWL